MDTNWCLMCGKHSTELYCSVSCYVEDGGQMSSCAQQICDAKLTESCSFNDYGIMSPLNSPPSPSFLSFLEPTCAKSHPAQLLAEIRRRPFASMMRELPRRRGLPFRLELKADNHYGRLPFPTRSADRTPITIYEGPTLVRDR